MSNEQGTTNTAHQDIEAIARLSIAKRCQTDLYYLAKYILGYDKMTDKTHGGLCAYTKPLLPNQPPIAPEQATQKTVEGGINQSPDAPTKNFTQEKNSATLSVERHGAAPISGSPISPLNPSDLEAGSLDSGSPVSPKLINTEDSSDQESSFAVSEDSIFDVSEREEELSDSFDPQKNFLLILMPRGTFKSSVVTIGFSLQMILNDPDARILIDSETFSKSKAFLAEIKGHLEGNEKYREIFHCLYGVYPDERRRDDTWSDSQLNISARKRRRKEPTFSCGGVDAGKTGMHYDLIIMDDLMSETNITTKEQIEKVVTHYKLSLSLLDPGKPLIVIGTRWHYLDIYQHILDYETHRFNVLIRRAWNPDGSLFFPEVLSTIELDRIRKTQGSYIFSCQYQNNPVDDETAIFKRSQIQVKEWELVKNLPINWYLLVDPSFEGEYSDFAALVTAGMDIHGNIYVRHVLRQKMTYSQIIDNMFHLYLKFKPKEIALETVATQKSIQYMLNDEQKRRGVFLPVKEIKSRTKSKEERIRALAPYYEFGRIFHVRECPQREELEYELLHFPKGKHDDVIDALATVLEIARPGGLKQARQEKLKPKLKVLLKPRSPITGV